MRPFCSGQPKREIDAAGAAGRGESRALQIGIFSSMGRGFLRELVPSYAERYPNMSLQISEGRLREQIALIRKGRAPDCRPLSCGVSWC